MSDNILESLESWLEQDFNFPEGLDGESGEFMDDAEAYDDSEGAEASKRRRTRRLTPAMRRAELRRDRARLAQKMSTPRSGGTSVSRGLQMAQTGIAKVDLDNKVQADVFGRALSNQQRQISRNAYTVAGIQLVDSVDRIIPNVIDPNIRSVMATLVAGLLATGEREKGLEGFIKSPGFITGVTLVAATAYARNQKMGNSISIFPETPPTLNSTTTTVTLSAFVVDRNGQPLPDAITWRSSNTAIADVNPTSGVVTRLTTATPGTVLITATAANAKPRSLPVIVT